MGMVLKISHFNNGWAMQGLVFSHVIYVDTSFSFGKFQFFYFTTPMSLKLFMFIVD
jgi:hypothetical protein